MVSNYQWFTGMNEYLYRTGMASNAEIRDPEFPF